MGAGMTVGFDWLRMSVAPVVGHRLGGGMMPVMMALADAGRLGFLGGVMPTMMVPRAACGLGFLGGGVPPVVVPLGMMAIGVIRLGRLIRGMPAPPVPSMGVVSLGGRGLCILRLAMVMAMARSNVGRRLLVGSPVTGRDGFRLMVMALVVMSRHSRRHRRHCQHRDHRRRNHLQPHHPQSPSLFADPAGPTPVPARPCRPALPRFCRLSPPIRLGRHYWHIAGPAQGPPPPPGARQPCPVAATLIPTSTTTSEPTPPERGKKGHPSPAGGKKTAQPGGNCAFAP